MVYDCVIVGAGVSGLQAANALRGAKRKDTSADFHVLVLEAADYVGGRVCTKTLGSTKVGVGARFVHGNQNSLLHSLFMNKEWKLDVLEYDYPICI